MRRREETEGDEREEREEREEVSSLRRLSCHSEEPTCHAAPQVSSIFTFVLRKASKVRSKRAAYTHEWSAL